MEETDFRGENARQGRPEVCGTVQEGSGGREENRAFPADRQDGRLHATLCLQASEVVPWYCVRHRVGVPRAQCVPRGIGM